MFDSCYKPCMTTDIKRVFMHLLLKGHRSLITWKIMLGAEDQILLWIRLHTEYALVIIESLLSPYLYNVYIFISVFVSMNQFKLHIVLPKHDMHTRNSSSKYFRCMQINISDSNEGNQFSSKSKA